MYAYDTCTRLPNNVGDLGKIIVATGFEWLPKMQKIAPSGHTDWVSSGCCERVRQYKEYNRSELWIGLCILG